MVSMMAKYYEEREGFSTYETDKGFATFKIRGDECYIKDIFIMPEHRRSGHAFEIGNEITKIAKENKCTALTGSVVPSLKGSTESMQALIKFGFKLNHCTNDFIVLVKEI